MCDQSGVTVSLVNIVISWISLILVSSEDNDIVLSDEEWTYTVQDHDTDGFVSWETVILYIFH